jgi:hypothetical protein
MLHQELLDQMPEFRSLPVGLVKESRPAFRGQFQRFPKQFLRKLSGSVIFSIQIGIESRTRELYQEAFLEPEGCRQPPSAPYAFGEKTGENPRLQELGNNLRSISLFPPGLRLSK